MHRAAIPPARRRHLRTCRDIRSYNTVLVACRKLLRYRLFSRRNGKRLRCSAVRCVVLQNDGNHVWLRRGQERDLQGQGQGQGLGQSGVRGLDQGNHMWESNVSRQDERLLRAVIPHRVVDRHEPSSIIYDEHNGSMINTCLFSNESIQRTQTPPRSKSDPGFGFGFTDLHPDICQNAPKMYWIHSVVGVSRFAKYRKYRPLTVWEMLINILKSLIPQWWEKLTRSRGLSNVHCPCLPCLVDVRYRDRPAHSPTRCTKCSNPPINGRCTNFIFFDAALYM